MEESDKRKIATQFAILTESLDVDLILPKLLAKGVFNLDLVEEIYTYKTRRRRAIQTLFFLIKRGPFAFDNFVKALIETNQVDLAKSLG